MDRDPLPIRPLHRGRRSARLAVPVFLILALAMSAFPAGPTFASTPREAALQSPSAIGPATERALAVAAQPGGTLTIYSGRSEGLVGRLLERFSNDTGIQTQVRYGDTTALAAAILEEGNNSPADVFFAQDAGALGALSQANRLARLPDYVLTRVESRFRSQQDNWVGVSGRARVMVYNPQVVGEENLPDSVMGLTHPVWRGRVGWAPNNASFQAFVTALRMTAGEEVARQWLSDMRANETRVFPNNDSIVLAVARGEIHVGLVNHYYVHAITRNQGPISAQNYHPRAGGVDAMVNIAGAGILQTSRNQEAAQRFVDYLLSQAAQEYFSAETYEYPLVQGIPPSPNIIPMDQIRTPGFDLANLSDLEGTLRLLRETSVL